MATRLFESVWRIVALIPSGRVASYGQVADLAGYPRHARHVARALKAAPASLALPWHRVINGRGAISFPVHSVPYRNQVDGLAAEGVYPVGGRIDLGRHRWRPQLDEILWGGAAWEAGQDGQDASCASSAETPGALPK